MLWVARRSEGTERGRKRLSGVPQSGVLDGDEWDKVSVISEQRGHE